MLLSSVEKITFKITNVKDVSTVGINELNTVIITANVTLLYTTGITNT